MSLRFPFVIAVFILLSALFAGCSGSGNPVLPDGNGSENPAVFTSGPERTPSSTHLWGYWDVYIDVETKEVAMLPDRGAMFTVNVVNFLNKSPLNLGFEIVEIVDGGEYLDVDINVTLKHPFPGLPEYNGYDVRGIFMGDGVGMMDYAGITYPVNGVDQYMLADPDGGNGAPDGYTRWFNLTEFSEGGMPLFQYTHGKFASLEFEGTSMLNPYRYFANGLEADEDLWEWIETHADIDGVFTSGASNTRNYYLRFPNEKGVVYGYAVIANWEGTEQEYHPSNAPEAVAVQVTDNSSVYYEDPSTNGGNLNLDISVWDWDAQLSNGAMDDFRIVLDSTVLDSPYYATPDQMVPTGGTDQYSTFTVEVGANNVTGVDDQEYWVIIEENYYDYMNPYDIPNLTEGAPLAAFFRFDLDVLDESPECPIPLPTACDPESGYNNDTYTLHIDSTNLEGDTGLAVYLDLDGVIDGSYDITGTDIQNVDVSGGLFDADFDLDGATPGYYYIVVTNACGETGVSDEKLFEIKEWLEGDIYVSNHPDFDGLAELGTMTNPYHTISAGIDASTVDDLILVDYGTGTYGESIYVYGGERHITVRAFNWYTTDGGRPLIDGPDIYSNQPTIQLVHTDYITFQGFKLTFGGASGSGWPAIAELTWTENIIIKDCFFTGDPPYDDARLVHGIAPYWTVDCEISNCLFKNINAGVNTTESSVQLEAIGGGWNVNLDILRNEFTDLQNEKPDGINLYVTAIDIVFDWGGINIQNNLVHHIEPGTEGGASLYFDGINNLSPLQYGSSSNGTGTIAFNTIDNLSVANAPSGSSARVWGIENTNSSSFGADIDMHSNILSEITGDSTQWVYGIYDDDITDYSCLYHILRGTTEYPWGNPSHEGTGNIYLDPMFENNTTSPYNYHLQTGSPCEGAGSGGEDMGCYGNLGSGEVIGLLSPE